MNSRRFSYRRASRRPLWRVFGDAMLAAIILGLMSAAALTFSGSQLRGLPGQTKVVDGDSLRIGTQDIRLWGIDAPELKQQCRNRQGTYACGRDARLKLIALVKNVTIDCDGLGADRYQRLLAVCRTAGQDINSVLVSGGFAYAYGWYVAEENAARSAKIGIWAAENERPKSYRDRTKAALDLAPGMLDALYQWLKRSIT